LGKNLKKTNKTIYHKSSAWATGEFISASAPYSFKPFPAFSQK